MLGFAFGLWTGLPQRRGSGGAAAGGRSLPARCRAEPGSGLVRGPGPWPSNAAAAPRPKGSALAAGNGRPWAIRRSRRGRGRAGTEIRGGGGVWRPGGRPRRAAPPAAKQKSMARGQRPRATLFQGASRPAAAPLRWVFHQRQGSFLQLPCALGFRLASSATGGARLPQFAKAVSWRRKSGLLQRRKATQKPGPTIYGPGYIIHLQEGTRHRPHTSGKAAAHALRAAAEQTPCRGLLTGGDLRPHVREYRRARSTRARSTRARSTRARTTA